MNIISIHFWRNLSLISAALLLSLLLLASVVALLVFIVRKPIRKYKYKDVAFFERLQKYTSPFRNQVMLFITFLAKHQFLIPANIILIIYFLFINKHSWFSIRIAAIALSSLVLMLLLKTLFKRKRPLAPLLKAAKGLSFPSGHAIMAVTFYGVIIYILAHIINNEWLLYLFSAVLIVLMLLIGFSRVYLRVHYVSDVIAGFIIGILWLYISLLVLNRMEKYIKNNDEIIFQTSLLKEDFQPTVF